MIKLATIYYLLFDALIICYLLFDALNVPINNATQKIDMYKICEPIL